MIFQDCSLKHPAQVSSRHNTCEEMTQTCFTNDLTSFIQGTQLKIVQILNIVTLMEC